tara:strand:- start:54 stop:434 length:381 start_codon:yes stop_codon:yes gene_type:complete
MVFLNDSFYNDSEKLVSEHNARILKMEAKKAMKARCIRNTSRWNETVDRWRANHKRLEELRANPSQETFRVDWFKVIYTLGLQTINIGTSIVCINMGAWPVTLFTVPALFGINLYCLTKDNKAGYE